MKNRKAPILILASASPRRRRLMQEHGYKFRVVPSHVSERMAAGLSPRDQVRALALKKGRLVAFQYSRDIVLAADTLVYIKGQVIGKPRDAAHARKILIELSGAWQKVYTGVAVVWRGGEKNLCRAAVSSVKLRKLSGIEIEKASRRHLDKAGAYAVQQKRDAFVQKINGDYDNVVGLPMRVVKELLGRAAHAAAKSVGHDIDFKR